MRLTVVVLGSIAVWLTGCASGGGRTGTRQATAGYFLQESGLSTGEFSSQRPAPSSSTPGRQVAIQTHRAVLGALNGVTRSTVGITHSLRLLDSSERGLGSRANGIFARHTAYGANQLPWLTRAIGGATKLTIAASEVSDPDMELGILRITGPRIEAALFGSVLLTAWLDFLNLADTVLRQCPFYGVERLFADINRVQMLIEPSMRALASLEPGQVEAAATAMPVLMGQLTQEFHDIREAARIATERGGQLMAAAQFIEMLTVVSTMKMSLPRLPPSAPALISSELVMSSGGLMMGSQLIVSADWVELLRRLVQAGVISAPAVSAAVRIHAGQVMMAQANQELPPGVREALGDGPEVRSMRVTGKAGAGMAEPPGHHVMPQERREWFEKRGFTGDMDIDQFCVKLETAKHQALHGGGNWRLGRTWPGEWNQMIMKALREAEEDAGRMLTRSEILNMIAQRMKRYDIPMNFTPWRGR
jgi:hypothetical protein